MTPHRVRLLLLFIAGSLPFLVFGGCRTWSSREERAAQAYNNGNLYREAGMYEDALSAYALALEHEPDMAAAIYNSALTLVTLDRSGEALETLQSLNQQDPGNLKVLRAMGWAAWKDGRVQASLDYYLSVLIVSPGDKVSLKAASEVYESSDRAGEAVEMRKLLLRMDNSTDSRMDLAQTLLMAERYSEALEIFRTVILQSPGNSDALTSASISAEHEGFYSESISYLLKLADGEGDAGDIWWHIAEIRLVESGNYDTGLTALKRALDEGFSDEDAYDDFISNTPPAVRPAVRQLLYGDL